MFKFLLPKDFCLNCSRDKKGICKVRVVFTCNNRRLVRSDKGKIRKVVGIICPECHSDKIQCCSAASAIGSVDMYICMDCHKSFNREV